MAAIAPAPVHTQDARNGLLAGLVAHFLWGFLPLLFRLLDGVGAVTIVADRTVWSLLLVGAILFATGRMGEVRAALGDRRTLISMALSAVLLAANWLLYVWAVETGQLLEASFGYFINPIVNIAIGMVVLGERQNRWQTVAIAISVLAIGLQAWGLGKVPYVALGLALSFGFYGYLRKTARVQSTSGLFVETLLLSPLAAGYLLYTFVAGGLGPHGDPGKLALLVLTGPATAVPLLLFAYAVQRMRLTTTGMLQYLAPSMQFLLAITVFGEHLNGTRLVSFALIWLSLLVYTADTLSRRRTVPLSTA